jgi:hypothetical protein
VAAVYVRGTHLATPAGKAPVTSTARHSIVLFCTSALVTSVLARPSARADDALQDLVTAWAGPSNALDAKDWKRLSNGDPIAMIVDSQQPAEMSAVGAIRLAVSPDEFVRRFRRIEDIERGSTVLQISRFGDVPSLQDVGPLTLDSDDVERIAECRPSDCDIQLPERIIARARQQHIGTPAAANTLFREYLVELVKSYRARGDAALEPYVNRDEPLSVAAAFRALDAGRRVLAQRVPAIARDIDGYPRTRPAGSDEFFYWSKLKFGFRPTVRVNHVLMAPVGNHPSGLRHVIISKQLYASHYFDAALEWRMVVADRTTGGSVLVYRTDVRSRSLTGFTASLFRGIVRSRARAGLERYLLTIKKSMETGTALASSIQ